jgi:hypothetical protein
MTEEKFEWGPLSRGIYTAMLWFTVLLGWVAADWLVYYVPLLIFLGLGLRPLLEITGLYVLFSGLLNKVDAARWTKITEKRRLQIERKTRDKKYKDRRTKDPRLPPNW